MNSIKIHKNARQSKRESERLSIAYNSITPPKYIQKRSVFNTVARLEKRFGYSFDTPEDELCQTLRNQRQEFQDKAVKYCGGYNFCKKQTRFDKMRMKEATGFKLEELPIKKTFKKIDQMLVKELKRDALLALFRNK